MLDKKTDSLQTKDFITIGVFSLIYFAVSFTIGGLAQMTPITFPFMPMIVALFTGSIFMLYATKIPKRGSIFILGILAGLLLFITGMFWMMSVFFIVLGFIADRIATSTNFQSFRKNLTAYCFFALAPMDDSYDDFGNCNMCGYRWHDRKKIIKKTFSQGRYSVDVFRSSNEVINSCHHRHISLSQR